MDTYNSKEIVKAQWKKHWKSEIFVLVTFLSKLNFIVFCKNEKDILYEHKA